jgi:hypothetical protein
MMILKLIRPVLAITSSSLKMNNKCKLIRSRPLMTLLKCSLTKPNLSILKRIISKIMMILMVATLINWLKLNSLLSKSCFSSRGLLTLKEIVSSIQLGRS